MGANFEYEIIIDEKLEMSNVEINEWAQKIFADARRAEFFDESMLRDDPGLEQFTHCNIRRDLVFDTEELACDCVDDELEDTKWSEYAHVVGVRGLGWFVGGSVHT